MAFISPFIQSLVNELLIFQKKNAPNPHLIFSKVMHDLTAGPGQPQTRALVAKHCEDSSNTTITKRAC